MKTSPPWQAATKPIDDHRILVRPGDTQKALRFCIEHFLFAAQEAINDHGYFAVALSGGSTPKAIFQELAKMKSNPSIGWEHFFIFWSDERSVPPEDAESNYHMAMEAGWKEIPVPKTQIFRMVAEVDIEKHAVDYEIAIRSQIPQGYFDLIMLGVGEDGHTASLFPHTEGLSAQDTLVIANFVPQKNTWRMSLTYECIAQAKHIALYALGEGKAGIIKKVLEGPYQPRLYPSQKVGTPENKSLWIVDDSAAALLKDA